MFLRFAFSEVCEMTLLKVKINGITDIVFVRDYDIFVKEVLDVYGDTLDHFLVSFIATFDPNIEQDDVVYVDVLSEINEAKEAKNETEKN